MLPMTTSKTSGKGFNCGHLILIHRNINNIHRQTNAVPKATQLVSFSLDAHEIAFSQPCEDDPDIPNNGSNCSISIVSPAALTNPDNMERERTLSRNPTRNNPSIKRKIPTRKANIGANTSGCQADLELDDNVIPTSNDDMASGPIDNCLLVAKKK